MEDKARKYKKPEHEAPTPQPDNEPQKIECQRCGNKLERVMFFPIDILNPWLGNKIVCEKCFKELKEEVLEPAFDVRMEVKLCKEHKKFFDEDVRIKTKNHTLINPRNLVDLWEEASNCTECKWTTTFGD